MLNTTRLLAAALGKQNRFAGAGALYRQTADIQRQVLGADHPDTIKTRFSLAYMLTLQGQYPAGEAIYRNVLAARRRILGAEHPLTTYTMTTLAMNLVHRRGRYPEAEELYRSALAVEQRQFGPESRYTTRAEEGLANMLLDEDRFAEAEALVPQDLARRCTFCATDRANAERRRVRVERAVIYGGSSSSWCRNARALFQLRFTVIGDNSSTSATSSMDRPAK